MPGSRRPHVTGNPQHPQPVQHPAALQLRDIGEFEAVRGPGTTVQRLPGELSRHVVNQRRRGGAGGEAPGTVAAAGGHHLDHGGMGSARQYAPARPRERVVQVVRDQRARETVQHIDPGGTRVAAQRRESLCQASRGDQVGGGHREPTRPQPFDDRAQQTARRGLGARFPHLLVVARRRHPRLVAGKGVQLSEGVRHEKTPRQGPDRWGGHLRPPVGIPPPAVVGLATGRGERTECGLVESAGHHQHRPVPGRGDRRPHPRRHVRLARPVARVGLRVAAHQSEVGVEPFRETVVGLDLEQPVPERVGGIHREMPAQPFRRLRVADLRVGIAVGALGECRMPGGQIDEADLGTGSTPRPQGDPLRRVVAERRPGGRGPFSVAVVTEHRDRQFVAEQQLVQPSVHLGRTLDQYVGRPKLLDGPLDEPCAGGGVVTHPQEHRRHQSASRWRASYRACHAGPRRRGTCCSR